MTAERLSTPAGVGLAVVVTGASSGIGLATTRLLASRGVTVFAGVRTTADGERITAEVGDRAVPVTLDVTVADTIAAASGTVGAHLQGRTLWGLVNNAGVATAGPLELQPLAEVRDQLEVNVVGQLAVTQALLPLLIPSQRRGPRAGRIVMVSSLSGRLADPFLGSYVASKHALEGLAGSLRRELSVHGVRVSIVAPGAVATPIWDKAAVLDLSRYDDTVYGRPLAKFREAMLREGRRGLDAAAVAEVIWRALSGRRPRRRYAPARRRLVETTLPTALPDAVYDQLTAWYLGLRRRSRTPPGG